MKNKIHTSNSLRSHCIPKVTGRFVNTYKPQADVYTLPTVGSPGGEIGRR